MKSPNYVEKFDTEICSDHSLTVAPSAELNYSKYWINPRIDVEVLKGKELREQKLKSHPIAREYDVVDINFDRPSCSTKQNNASHTVLRHKKKKRRKSPIKVLKKSKPNRQPLKQCPMRIAELAVPTKRHCIETWRNKHDTLPSYMVERLRQIVMDEKPIVKIHEAINCFRTRKSSVSTPYDRKPRLQKLKNPKFQDIHLHQIRLLCGIFGYRITKKLVKPLNVTLNSQLKNISQIVNDEISFILSNRHKSQEIDKHIQMEIADKVTIWIVNIVEDATYKLLLEDFQDLEEQEGFIWDLIDNLIDTVMINLETDKLPNNNESINISDSLSDITFEIPSTHFKEFNDIEIDLSDMINTILNNIIENVLLNRDIRIEREKILTEHESYSVVNEHNRSYVTTTINELDNTLDLNNIAKATGKSTDSTVTSQYTFIQKETIYVNNQQGRIDNMSLDSTANVMNDVINTAVIEQKKSDDRLSKILLENKLNIDNTTNAMKHGINNETIEQTKSEDHLSIILQENKLNNDNTVNEMKDGIYTEIKEQAKSEDRVSIKLQENKFNNDNTVKEMKDVIYTEIIKQTESEDPLLIKLHENKFNNDNTVSEMKHGIYTEIKEQAKSEDRLSIKLQENKFNNDNTVKETKDVIYTEIIKQTESEDPLLIKLHENKFNNDNTVSEMKHGIYTEIIEQTQSEDRFTAKLQENKLLDDKFNNSSTNIDSSKYIKNVVVNTNYTEVENVKGQSNELLANDIPTDTNINDKNIEDNSNITALQSEANDYTSDDSIKKVKFSDINIGSRRGDELKKSENLITTFQHYENDVHKNPQDIIKHSIHFAPPNNNLLSEADEPWPDNLPLRIEKVTVNVSKSVLSLGKIIEAEEKYITPPEERDDTLIYDNSRAKDYIQIENNLIRKEKVTEHVESFLRRDDYIETKWNSKESRNSGDSKHISTHFYNHSPTIPKRKNTDMSTINYNDLKNNLTVALENSLIGSLEKHDIKEKSHLRNPMFLSKMTIVHLPYIHIRSKTFENNSYTNEKLVQTDNSLKNIELQLCRAFNISIDRGYPAFQIINNDNTAEYQINNTEIRKWCKGLENVLDNLEIWLSWIESTSTYFMVLKYNEFYRPHKRRNASKWIKLQKDVKSDAELWFKLSNSLRTGLKSYRKYYETHKVRNKCPKVCNS